MLLLDLSEVLDKTNTNALQLLSADNFCVTDCMNPASPPPPPSLFSMAEGKALLSASNLTDGILLVLHILGRVKQGSSISRQSRLLPNLICECIA